MFADSACVSPRESFMARPLLRGGSATTHGLLVGLAWLLSPAAAKIIQGVAKLSSQETEVYLTKFSFSPFQQSHIKGTFSTGVAVYFDNHPHDLTLCLYDEAAWKAFRTAMLKGSLCTERRAMATWSTKIVPAYRESPTHAEASQHEFAFTSHLKPPDRYAHYWFAELMDCYLEEYDAHPPEMKYHITFTNGESQLPQDERGMTTINLLALLGMAAWGAYYFGRALMRMRAQGQAHLLTLLFALAYGLQTLSVACEYLHLARFERDGKGLRWRHTVFALDFFSGLLQSVSELLISVLLIALAFGWTLGLESQARAERQRAEGRGPEGRGQPPVCDCQCHTERPPVSPISTPTVM